jgi:D-arabinose 1-dehydrogenase-like Zn-dependent alcohol dehydrogenase
METTLISSENALVGKFFDRDRAIDSSFETHVHSVQEERASYQAWVATAPKKPMILDTVPVGPLGDEEVEVAVEHCGLCHSDISILNNEWGISQFPAILGHEAVGVITALGPKAKGLKLGQRVGVIGIGGLGHMAVKFASAYGCDVTAFTSSESKFEEAKGFGANHIVASRDCAALKKLAGSFDLLISTVSVKLDWDALIGTLAPNGRLHIVGVVLEPVPVAAFSLIAGQRSISGSPTGSPVGIETMLDFAARHNITPQTEHFPMSRINEAFARLDSGKARYRIVLDADF